MAELKVRLGDKFRLQLQRELDEARESDFEEGFEGNATGKELEQLAPEVALALLRGWMPWPMMGLILVNDEPRRETPIRPKSQGKWTQLLPTPLVMPPRIARLSRLPR